MNLPWISIEERLPEKNVPLKFRVPGFEFDGHFDGDYWWERACGTRLYGSNLVSHWLPISPPITFEEEVPA